MPWTPKISTPDKLPQSLLAVTNPNPNSRPNSLPNPYPNSDTNPDPNSYHGSGPLSQRSAIAKVQGGLDWIQTITASNYN